MFDRILSLKKSVRSFKKKNNLIASNGNYALHKFTVQTPFFLKKKKHIKCMAINKKIKQHVHT